MSKLKPLLCLFIFLMYLSFGHAQVYPEKPIHIIVPFAAGGGLDIAARTVANGVSEGLKQLVVVENKPGANSILGATHVARSAPDGYTFLFTSGSTVSVLPHITRSLPFDPKKDLLPVGKVAKFPFFLVVHPSLPVYDLKQFLSFAKSKPGEITYGSAGNGTGAHIGFELLKSAVGMDVTHIPYKSTNEAMPDLLTGRIKAMMADFPVVRRALEDNTLRVLAVSTKDRSFMLPGVPTAIEQGVAGFDLEIWFGIFAPAGTSNSIIVRFNEVLQSFLKSPSAVNAFTKAGYTIDSSSADSLGNLVAAESTRWGQLARAGALKMD